MSFPVQHTGIRFMNVWELHENRLANQNSHVLYFDDLTNDKVCDSDVIWQCNECAGYSYSIVPTMVLPLVVQFYVFVTESDHASYAIKLQQFITVIC